MDRPAHSFAYQSMGTTWEISIWDELPAESVKAFERKIIADSEAFDRAYSRFKKDSVVWSLVEQKGVVEVPPDLTAMLRLYETLYRLSKGKVNPLIGFAISDMGYDETYSLKPKDVIRPVPPLPEALRIVDNTHIELLQPALIDVGAVGKGYFVDKLAAYLAGQGVKRFLVNGSGDIAYRTDGPTLRAGLEHPGDVTKAIGVVTMDSGAMCGSAGNRRRWGNYHHTIDPLTLTSPEEIIATWVRADSAAIADGIATALFLCEPEEMAVGFDFECCLLNKEFRVRQSIGFGAELF